MYLNTLKPAKGAKKEKVRVGRGWSSGLGKTCGKGHKGQRARGKGKVPIGFEGGQMPFHRRVPKSGFTALKSLYHAEVRLSDLDALAKLGEKEINLMVLKQHNVIALKIKTVKIIASGELAHPVTVKALKCSKGAVAIIEKNGGRIDL